MEDRITVPNGNVKGNPAPGPDAGLGPGQAAKLPCGLGGQPGPGARDLNGFPDGTGLPFSGYRSRLPASIKDWPPANRCKDPKLLAAYAERFDYCQLCGRTPPETELDRLAIHHIICGWKRCHEHTAIIRLCVSCHDWAHARAWERLPVILWAKLRTDRESVSWVRLAVLNRSHLPEPRADAKFLQEFNRYRRVQAWQVSGGD